MKYLANNYSIILVFFFTTIISLAQPIPIDSLYLGQLVPGNTPKAFNLEATPGSFAAERIAISKDGSEIYYSEIKSYYPIVGDRIRYYKYENKKWNKRIKVKQIILKFV